MKGLGWPPVWMAYLGIAIVAAAVALAGRGSPAEAAGPAAEARIASDLADPVARGAYLATAANCRGCHTARGGEPYAGGRALPTSFGTFQTPNLTPDAKTGLGRWTAEDFWRALHEGLGRDGSPLYPAFPYTHYTAMTRADSDAIFAYLRSLPAVEHENRPHDLQFPYDRRWLLHVWRALYFTPGRGSVDVPQDPQQARGAYLADALGHCTACHRARNGLGALREKGRPEGGTALGWYAPALDADREAGMARWSQDDVVALLKTGLAHGAVTSGPMADVVFDSLQHLRDEDLQAIAAYLRGIPDRDAELGPARRVEASAALDANLQRGAKAYADRCADCHGREGEGRSGIVPLAGNRDVAMASKVDAIRAVLYGGYAPGTAGNPRPYGMPPFHAQLGDREVADILTFVRASWGNAGTPVADFEVTRQRTGPLW